MKNLNKKTKSLIVFGLLSTMFITYGLIVLHSVNTTTSSLTTISI